MSAFECSAALYRQRAQGQALGFAHAVHQRTRFAGLRRHARVAGANVLDFGCGHGDLYAELVCAGEAPARYHGVDLEPANLALARARIGGLLGADLARAGVTLGGGLAERYDVVACLAVLSVDEGERTEALWLETLRDLWARTGATLVFDLLREEPGFPHPGHRRLPIGRIAELAASLTRNFTIDATLADHYALVAAHRAPTGARRFWELRDG
jgi:SAM-dependent methyltransferase